MRRVEGSAGIQLMECVNPVKNKWRIRWDVQELENGTASYMEHEFGHKPTIEEVRSIVMVWYNERTDESILSGFRYKGMSIWLSQENQFNYKSAFDLAVQTEGKTLPVTFKFGTDEEPSYQTFGTLDELTDSYMKVMAHIQTVLSDGWKKKDAFNPEEYQMK